MTSRVEIALQWELDTTDQAALTAMSDDDVTRLVEIDLLLRSRLRPELLPQVLRRPFSDSGRPLLDVALDDSSAALTLTKAMFDWSNIHQ